MTQPTCPIRRKDDFFGVIGQNPQLRRILQLKKAEMGNKLILSLLPQRKIPEALKKEFGDFKFMIHRRFELRTP